jgi:hypothetical protein
VACNGFERLAARGGLVDVVALVPERRRDGVDDRRLVVDDEDPPAATARRIRVDPAGLVAAAPVIRL